MVHRVGEQVPNHLDKGAMNNHEATHTTVFGQLIKKHLVLRFQCPC
jgi:hypothetical protein